MSSVLRTAKNTLMLFSGSATRMIATLLFITYAANYLGVEGFGKYSLITHYFELFVSLSATAAAILLTRDASKWKRNKDKLFSAAIVVVVVLGLSIPVIFIPLAYCFQYSRETCIGCALAFTGLIPAAIASLYEALFTAAEKTEHVTVGNAIEALSRIGISTLLLLLGYGVIEVSFVFFLSRTTQLSYYYFAMRRLGLHRLQFSLKATIRFAKRWRVFVAENWLATISMGLDVIILSWLAGETAVGLYSAAWRYVRLGGVAARSFTTAVFPTMTRLHSESRERFQQVFQYTFRVMSMVALPIIGAVCVIPSRVVDLIFKKEFAGSAPILQVLIWVLLLEFVNPFLSYVLFSQGRQRFAMYVAAIGLCCNFALMLTLVPRLGAVGSAISCVASGLIALSFYLAYTCEIRLIVSLAAEFLRIALAALVMAIAISQISTQSWFLLIPIAVVVYTLMLFLVQALRSSDLQDLKKSIFHRAVA